MTVAYFTIFLSVIASMSAKIRCHVGLFNAKVRHFLDPSQEKAGFKDGLLSRESLFSICIETLYENVL